MPRWGRSSATCRDLLSGHFVQVLTEQMRVDWGCSAEDVSHEFRF